ncbi:MAG: hypothetical protein Q9210_006746, partial [Variospora velana]
PLSFVASIVAVSTLAGNVVTKGYRYLKAVKDCPEDVRRLIAEVNVLCGILSRLTILLESHKRGTGASKDPVFRKSNGLDDVSDQGSASDSSSESEHAAETSTDELEVPDFIYECRRTLDEIQEILNKFARSGGSPTRDSGKSSRLNISRPRSFEPKDLKWPLSSKKTVRLIEALERHKNTCTIALAQDGMIGIHAVLKETKLSNKYLADIRANQQTMVKLQLTQAQGEFSIFMFLPFGSTAETFKRERQDGTGTWLFDLPEMTNWLESSNDALWVYGIPGAGKTTLSTLVVDEILTKKRSNSVGTAYFYVRHDDKESHKPSNVLGSLISQLARHNREALADLMKLYAQHQTHGLAAPDEQDLNEKLHKISQHFKEVYIMIDGLDECGSLYDADRRRLVKAIAGLHTNKEGSVRTLVFSRKESDIEKEFVRMQFHTVSIAATSGDLRLFANAWSGELDVQSERLKAEIVDALVNQAKGMFLWVRAQVDYLQRLPNDKEKRKALTRLPPDLPQTYIRIFETMDKNYPRQTTTYIKRLLTWLIFDSRKVHYDNDPKFTIDTLREAICIEDAGYWPTMESIPTRDNVCRWLGCLLRVDRWDDRPNLSHFTMKEFLNDDTELVSSSHAARQYMVAPEDERHLVNVCLKYAMHSHSSDTSFASRQDPTEQVVSERPFYRYVVGWLPSLLSTVGNLDAELDRLIKVFLCMPPCREFELWEICYARWIDENEFPDEDDIHDEDEIIHHLPTPLHFACFTGLKGQVEMLLDQGVNPNATDRSKGSEILPIHLSIVSRNFKPESFMSWRNFDLYVPGSTEIDGSNDDLTLGDNMSKIVAAPEPSDVQITRMLVQSGADVNYQLRLGLLDTGGGFANTHDYVTTPLVLALLLAKYTIASLLLDKGKGANWDARASDARVDNEPNGISDLCSVRELLRLLDYPEQENGVRLAAKLSGCDGLMTMLEEWKLSRDQDRLVTQSTGSPPNNDADLQTEFVNAFSSRNWQEVRELLTKNPNLDVNCADENGVSAIHRASEFEGDALSFLLERGANPNLMSHNRITALCVASQGGWLENMKLLLRLGANIEHRGHGGWTALLLATKAGQNDAVKLLLDFGADINAALDDGYGVMHLASMNNDTTVLGSLLARGNGAGLEHRAAGGWTPLLLAIDRQYNEVVQLLLDFGADINSTLDNGEGAIHLAIQKYDATVFDLLLTRGIKCFSPNNYGTTPLHLACEIGLQDVVQRLLVLSTGVSESVNADSLLSGTPLDNAAQGGHDSIVKQLLDHGAISGSVGSGNVLGSALMVACAAGHDEVVQTLLSRGAALEVEGSRFKSAEGTARAFRKDKILKILEEHEKNSNQQGGRAPIDGSVANLDDQKVPCTGEAEKNGDHRSRP